MKVRLTSSCNYWGTRPPCTRGMDRLPGGRLPSRQKQRLLIACHRLVETERVGQILGKVGAELQASVQEHGVTEVAAELQIDLMGRKMCGFICQNMLATSNNRHKARWRLRAAQNHCVCLACCDGKTRKGSSRNVRG